MLPRNGPNDETEQSDDDVDGRSSCGRARAAPSAERCRRRYHGDETAVAVTTRSGSGRMIVPDPNVVGFVLELLPPPLPALLPRCASARRRRRLPRERCRRRSYLRYICIYIINVFFLVSFSLFFYNPSTAPPPHDPRRQLPTVAERRATPPPSSWHTVSNRVPLTKRLTAHCSTTCSPTPFPPQNTVSRP